MGSVFNQLARRLASVLIVLVLLVLTAVAADPNTIVHITETGTKYHKAGCQYLKKSDIEVTLSKAKEMGLTPCKKCKPPK